MRRNSPPLWRSIRQLLGTVLIDGAASIAAHTLPAARAAAGDPQTCEQASGDEAIAACIRAIASGAYQGHDLAKLHYDRAFEYHALGDEDRAIAGYSEAISLDPNYALAFYGRANSWQAKRDNDRAIADFNESIRLDPDYADSYNNRGTAWLADQTHHCRFRGRP